MASFLNKPYPLYDLDIKRIIIIIGSGLFVSLFLIIFQPFGTDQFQHPNKNLILLGYSMTIILSFLMIEFCSRKLFPKFFDDRKWVIWKQILFNVINVGLSIAACYVYKQMVFGLNITVQGLFGFFTIALPIASFIVIAWIIIDYIAKLKKYEQGAKEVEVKNWNEEIPSTPNPNLIDKIELSSQNGKDQIQLSAKELLYIQSADNYCQIFTIADGKIKSQLLRNTLNNISKQIELSNITRCHRSFIINLKHVREVSGNAQGYTLHLETGQHSIPVARSKSKQILGQLQA